MIIDQLPSANPNLTDETVTEQGTNLFKTTWQKIRDLFLSSSAAFSANVSVGGALDVVPRRASAVVSSAGWYRILTYTAPSAQIAQGRYSMMLDLIVGDLTNDVHRVTLAFASYGLAFLDESGKVTTQLFDKVRYTYNGSIGYVDVHFIGTSARTVWAFIDPFTNPDYRSRIVTNDFTAVNDAPAGETIVATYDFAGNTVPVDISSSFSFNTTDITILSSALQAWYDPKAKRVSIDYNLRANAAFAVGTAFLTCTEAMYRVGAQKDFPAMIYNGSTNAWDTYFVRAATTGTFNQRLSANATRVYGHIEYYL